ncbi:lipopolysaccharide biosynthesis protein [Rummeliibacillus pycnus]|uniref:lipopolysaccharide biosynthesis protein n=1 Tax=Rummeliibacillus pycnus TaxID=101070 RepID=UPI0037C8DE9A
MERGGAKGFQFVVMIILARLLEPKDFGLIVLVSIFITFAGVFVQSGFNTALIQKNTVDELDFSSVFYLNLFISIILYIMLFFTAPFLTIFFKEPQLESVLRVLSLILFITPFSSVQNAVIARNMEFKILFFSTLGAILISSIVGIIMAYASLGVWALVGQQLTNQLMITIILWFTVKWRPNFIFSMERIKILFSFGWKLLISSLLDTLSSNFQNLLVGKIFNPVLLGFYNRGEQFPNLIVSNIDGAINSVMLPTLSFYQDDNHRIKSLVRRSIVTTTFIIFPIMIGLAVIAEPLVKILLTDKWLPAVPMLQIFCISYALWPIHTANLQVMNALGRSDLFLKLEIIKVILSLIILGISVNFGIYGIIWGTLVMSFLSTFINAYPNQKLIAYSFQEQWKDIIPSFFLSLVMGILVYTIHWFGMIAIFTIIIQVFAGVTIYVGLARMFKLECFNYLLLTLKEMLRNKRNRKTKLIKNEV